MNGPAVEKVWGNLNSRCGLSGCEEPIEQTLLDFDCPKVSLGYSNLPRQEIWKLVIPFDVGGHFPPVKLPTL
jgi:hypothetical protein